MGATYTNLLYHAIFSTKHRVPLINPELKSKLYPYIGGIVRDEGGTLLDINGIPDHVHLALKLKTTHTVSGMLQHIKGSSSKWVNATQKQSDRFEWQVGFAAFTVSESQLPKLLAYIRKQEQHHKKVSFKEELIELLKRHNVPYDPRYVFD